MWQLTYDNIPHTMKSSFNIRSREYGENNLKNHIPKINLKLLKRNIVYPGPRIWSSLKNDIKIKKSIFSFKKALKNELLEKGS